MHYLNINQLYTFCRTKLRTQVFNKFSRSGNIPTTSKIMKTIISTSDYWRVTSTKAVNYKYVANLQSESV